VADEELLAATVTPERSHLLEACCFLAATLFYRHCLHVLILDELAIVWQPLRECKGRLQHLSYCPTQATSAQSGRTRPSSAVAPPWDIALDNASIGEAK
jgi:hypothetical protein